MYVTLTDTNTQKCITNFSLSTIRNKKSFNIKFVPQASCFLSTFALESTGSGCPTACAAWCLLYNGGCHHGRRCICRWLCGRGNYAHRRCNGRLNGHHTRLWCRRLWFRPLGFTHVKCLIEDHTEFTDLEDFAILSRIQGKAMTPYGRVSLGQSYDIAGRYKLAGLVPYRHIDAGCWIADFKVAHLPILLGHCSDTHLLFGENKMWFYFNINKAKNL